MRHRVYGKHLSKNKDERDRLFKNLIRSLFTYGTIKTSWAKAKAIKGLVDRVINLAKEKKTQPQVQSFLTDKNLQERLIKEIVPKLAGRTSGYTSMVQVGLRLGDQTMMVRMSLIGAEELRPNVKEEKKILTTKKEVTGKTTKRKPAEVTKTKIKTRAVKKK